MDRETFLKLPVAQVAELARKAGPQVCVFPINGTRRWFALEHAGDVNGDPIEAYMDAAGKRHVELYRMCFEHGLDTLLTPVFGSELLSRGGRYMQKIGMDGLARLAAHPDFVDFYHEHRVRVRFYGDYRGKLAGTPFANLIDVFDRVTRETADNDSRRLFFGVFADDPAESIAALSVDHFRRTGAAPTRRELVALYYGEYVEPATLFIGFDKFSVFDYPLLGLGSEDLYFTVAPSLYLAEPALRSILYDKLFLRPASEPDYQHMSREDLEAMRAFYDRNLDRVLGVGELRNSLWYPVPMQTEQ